MSASFAEHAAAAAQRLQRGTTFKDLHEFKEVGLRLRPSRQRQNSNVEQPKLSHLGRCGLNVRFKASRDSRDQETRETDVKSDGLEFGKFLAGLLRED